jgi:hypothetical protein
VEAVTERRTQAMDVRMAVLESKVDDLEAEMARTRDRLHTLDSSYFAIKVLSERIETLTGSVKMVAKEAAHEAIELAFTARAASGARRWDLRLKWVLTGAAFGGFISALVFGILH